ncbi:MAG: PAS domain S-box protein [Desulfatibacillum sp.]|nr:PAS domain S-box protein [Desulfatibacillum sp.]
MAHKLIKMAKMFLEGLFPSALEWEKDHTQARTNLFLTIFLLLGGVVVLIFGVQDLLNGSYIAGGAALIVVTGWIGCLVYINRIRNKAFLYRTVFVLLLLLFGEAAWAGGESGSKALWSLFLPLSMLFLAGKDEGLAWALGSLAVVLWIMADPWALMGSHQYPGDFLIRYGLVYFIICILAYVFEISRLHCEAGMEREHRHLLEEKVFLKNSIIQGIHTEEALRKSQSLYELLSENMKDVIWTADLSFHVTYISPGIKILQGYTPEEIVKKRLQTLLISDTLEKTLLLLNQVLEQKSTEPISLEMEVLHRDGHSVWVETVTNLYLDQNGEPAGFVGSSRDISDRKKAEAALRKNEEKFRAFVENAPVGMFTVDLQGAFTYCNKKILQMTGYKTQDVLGRQFYQMVHPEDLPKIIRAMEDAAAKVRTTPYLQVQMKDAFDRTMWMVITSEMLMQTARDGTRIPLGFQCFVEDITERKFAEMEKLRLERQLRQAHKMEAIGTLAGGIAHDFNNILSPIIGYAEMLRDTLTGNSGAVRDLGEVLKAARRAKDLISQILTFSRKSEEKPQPVTLAPIVSDVLNLIRATLPATIQIYKNIDPRCGTVMADPTQMHQVVMNLCTNAYQIMRQTGGVLEVTLKEMDLKEEDLSPVSPLKPGPYARLSISDTGEGMSPETLERIFEPYFTTKPIGEGTGMGLAVAHAIVVKHRGEIRVKSQPGHGTVFNVFLPVLEIQRQELPFVPSQRMEKGDEKVLLVEDEKSILDMTTKMLEKLGYQVTPFMDPQAALESLQTNPFAYDLLLTDMTMPHMTGFELAVKCQEIKPALPILLCTGFSDQFSDKKFKNTSIFEVLFKPVSMHVMASALRRALDAPRP